MRAPTNFHRGDLEFNMTPMIDVVFLLIIFFLLSSHLAQQEVQLELDLPSAASGRRDEEDDARRMVVNVELPGVIMIGGRRVAPEALQRIIGVEREQAGGDLEVRIRPDRRVPYGVVEPIMLACARGGVWNVTFAVVRDDAPP